MSTAVLAPVRDDAETRRPDRRVASGDDRARRRGLGGLVAATVSVLAAWALLSSTGVTVGQGLAALVALAFTWLVAGAVRASGSSDFVDDGRRWLA